MDMMDQATDESVEITYKSTDLQPPLFLAGSFSNPPWTPFEMEHQQTSSGEHVFSKTIRAKPGTTVQYKIRVGSGDWWVLDGGRPTTTDNMGNRNNVLEIKAKQSHVVERPPTPPPDSPLTPRYVPKQSKRLSPPSRSDKFRIVNPADQTDDFLSDVGLDFAHELAGEADNGPDKAPVFAYEFAGGDHDRTQSFSGSEHSAGAYPALGPNGGSFRDEFDLKDPTLERFPSNREDILERVRTIETGLTEDVPVFDGYPASPVVSVGRKSSADLNNDFFPLSPSSSQAGSFSNWPQSDNAAHSAEPRNRSISKGSTASDTSPSLQCIMEETHPDEEDEAEMAPLSMRPNSKAVVCPDVDVSPKTVTPTRDTSSSPDAPPTIVVHEDSTDANAETNDAAATQQGKAETQQEDSSVQQAPQTDTIASPPQEARVITAKSSGWLYAFLRIVFVDWIGAILGRIVAKRSV